MLDTGMRRRINHSPKEATARNYIKLTKYSGGCGYTGVKAMNIDTQETTESHSKGLLGYLRSLLLGMFSRQKGGLMIEALVSVSLMAIVGTAVLSGLSTTHISGAKTERQSVAENLARNEMAAVFSSPYVDNLGTYPAVAAPGGYAITASTAELDDLKPDPDIQKVTVSVTFDGAEVFQLQSIKIR